MIVRRVILKVNNSEYDILKFNYKFQRDIDAKGRPRGVYYGGEILVQIESTDDTKLFRLMTHKEMPPVNGVIEVLSGQDEQCVRRIDFKGAYIYAHGEQMQGVGWLPMITTIAISPMRLDFNNNMLRLDRLWPRAPHGWQKHEPEEVKYVKSAPSAPPTALITSVNGKSSALANAEVEYEVTSYNLKVSESDEKRVKWVVRVDGKDEVLQQQGEKLKLCIKEEWTGEEITVMPYLKRPIEKVSVKTKVEKWFLPRVIIQTKTKAGYGNKSERSIYEYQDCFGKGITPASMQIADDMHYGDGIVHTGNFTLAKIKDANVLKNIRDLSSKYNDVGLFGLFRELIKYTSMDDLEAQNLAMVSQVQQKNNLEYKNGVLTNAVFAHNSTKSFIRTISDAIVYAVKNGKGNLNEANFEKAFQDNKIQIRRPVFSGKMDRLKGLTIALNDTWGFRVTITQYSFNAQTKECQATIRYRIIDHFGLDVEDVISYGTKEKVIGKLGVLGAIISGVMTPRDERGNTLSQSIGDAVAEEVAHGFCAWFILQHIRGYKPFVTIMEKEETLKFTL